MKNFAVVVSLVVLSACSQSPTGNNSNASNNLPNPNGSSINGQVYVKAKAEFNLSSTPQGQSSQLIKQSFQSCAHGQCTDLTDITVTNSVETQFALIQQQGEQTFASNAGNAPITSLINLQVGTLFENNLYSCGVGGTQMCTSAIIRIYTTDNNGAVAGSGLYNAASQQSVPILVSGGTLTLPTAIPYFNETTSSPADDHSSLTVDSEVFPQSQQVISLANGDFADSYVNSTTGIGGYNLSADFTQAGAGIYTAHVVVEYDLVGAPVLTNIVAQGSNWGGTPNVSPITQNTLFNLPNLTLGTNPNCAFVIAAAGLPGVLSSSIFVEIIDWEFGDGNTLTSGYLPNFTLPVTPALITIPLIIDLDTYNLDRAGPNDPLAVDFAPSPMIQIDQNDWVLVCQ